MIFFDRLMAWFYFCGKINRLFMKRNALAVILLFAGLVAVSCIKEEAPNAEADIESCTLAGDVLNRDPVIENDRVTLFLKKGTDLTSLSPEFTLTPGAMISPASGTERDFTTPQEYTVTSEDGRWKKKYKVEATTSGITTRDFHFENVRIEGKYQIFYETNAEGEEDWAWSSGNPGFAMTGVGKSCTDYPTYQSEDGYKGKCLTLTTRKTGSFGAMMGMPIASGNLFIGTFDLSSALTGQPLSATKFGKPFDYIPKSLHGYYKYRSGEVFYKQDASASDGLKPVPDKKDRFNIYAVFYESTKEMETVDGTNALSEDNPNVFAVAKIEQDEAVETDKWTLFEIPFKPRTVKTVDADKLKAGRYSLAIVFASSLDGDRFEGAPGSTLCVDEVTLEYKEPEEYFRSNITR